MTLYLTNSKQIHGDLIKSAGLRFDLSPVSVTLEASIRINDDMGAKWADKVGIIIDAREILVFETGRRLEDHNVAGAKPG